MNSMNLKFGDVTVRGSPTCSDRHYVKKIIFCLDYCFLSVFSIFVVLFNPYPAYCNYCAFAMFAQNWHKKLQLRFKTVANLGKSNTKYVTIVR